MRATLLTSLVLTALSVIAPGGVCQLPALGFQGRAKWHPLPAAGRVLSLSLTEPEIGGYDAAFATGLAAGMQSTSLSLAWDDLETAPGVYQPAVDWLGIANAFYPAVGLPISLEVNPIDTNNLRVPADLAGRSFDDPVLVARYLGLLDHVFSRIPDTLLVTFSIGNEIDAWLGTDLAAWQAYRVFFQQVSAHARALRPGLVVGAKLTYDGLMGPAFGEALALAQHADGVFATYYPLQPDFTVRPPGVVVSELGALLAAYPGSPIYLLEIGYPSSALCNSSEALQAAFIRNAFKAWDLYASRLRLMEFTWLHDISAADVAAFELYYGISAPAFAGFLGTLGLRAYDGLGVAKPAYLALVEEAAARGW